MEVMDVETVDPSSKDEEVTIADEEVNLNEIEQLDEILGSSDKIKMLDFERQMFLDCVYSDGLVICGK